MDINFFFNLRKKVIISSNYFTFSIRIQLEFFFFFIINMGLWYIPHFNMLYIFAYFFSTLCNFLLMKVECKKYIILGFLLTPHHRFILSSLVHRFDRSLVPNYKRKFGNKLKPACPETFRGKF